jgi:hypothetical protein
MKAFFFTVLTATLIHLTAFAQTNPELGDVAIDFNSTQISSMSYDIEYPNLDNDIVSKGRQLNNQMVPDCLALVFDADAPSTDQMLSLAKSIDLLEGSHGENCLKPQVKNGTILFYLPAGLKFMTTLKIQTLDHKSFVSNKQRLLGSKAMNLRLEYRRNCHGIK